MSKFWKWSDSVESIDSKLILEGPISEESWWGDEVTPQEFRQELNKHNGDLTVILNSGGGDVFAGMAIYNALREFEGNVTVRVDGLAASIASVVAMAADKIIMSPGSMMMIHKPWTLVIGDANDLDKTKEILQGIEDSIVPIYASRTGMPAEDISDMIEAETWMTAEQAVEYGFADEMTEAKKKVTISDAIKNALNGEFAFSMSATKKSLQDFASKVAAQQEEVVTPQPTPDEVPEIEPVVEPKTEDKVEAKVEGKEQIKSTKDKEEKMSEVKDDVKEIAKDQVVEPTTQPIVVAKSNAKEYLKSKQALEDYAKVLVKNAGRQTSDVKAGWEKHLAKMGITNPEVLLPAAVVQSIEDAFKEGGEIWNLVNKTGLDVYKVAWDTVDGEDSRAKGYNREDEAEKAEEVITLADRTLRPQFIYKYLTLPKEVVRENRSTGALLQYVLSELPRRIVREVERAIIIGDGRADGSDYKISSFTSLKDDADDGNVFAQTYTPAGDESAYETLLRARSLVKAEGAKYLVTKSDWVTELLLLQGVNGGYIFQPGTNVANVFGFAGVITPDWFDDSADADNDAYIFTPSQYRTVGDNNIESFSNFLLKTNMNEYLQEIWAGGGLTARNSAVAISATTSS